VQLFWICLGGAFGTGARFLVSTWLLRALGAGFPYGTLAVNLTGSFLLGALMYVGTETAHLPATVRLALTTGVMGGYTTYSTFSYETMRYLHVAAWGMAALNVGVTVFGGLAASLSGWALARVLFGG
jgi:CrcB protein